MKNRTGSQGKALQLSKELRRVVATLAADVPAQVGQMLASERAVIDEYASVGSAELGQDVHEVTTAHARIWYESLLADQAPTAAELERFAEVGQRRQRQGFSLPSLLQAVRIASTVLWTPLIIATRRKASVQTELLIKVSPYLLLHFDLISQALSRGYMEEGQKRARWREQLQNELSALLFSRPEDLAGFRELTQALRLDATAAHAALALRLGSEPGHSGRDRPMEIDSLLEQVSAALGVPVAEIVSVVRHGLLLLWVPVAHGESLVMQEQQLARKAAGLISKVGAIAVGVGLPDNGPNGWRQSADQAMQALEIGRCVGSGEAVMRYAELALDAAVRASPGLGRYLESLLERLAAEPALLDTLHAFLNHCQHRKGCAMALGIHVNTLAYRLERIESLLGARLDNPYWLTRLYVALRLQPAQIRH
jgi:carbohydrate diacid regulator